MKCKTETKYQYLIMEEITKKIVARLCATTYQFFIDMIEWGGEIQTNSEEAHICLKSDKCPIQQSAVANLLNLGLLKKRSREKDGARVLIIDDNNLDKFIFLRITSDFKIYQERGKNA